MVDKIDPWASLDIKNYDTIMKKFGVSPVQPLIKKLPKENIYFSREYVIGHKSLEPVLAASKKKQPFSMLTGLMPSGKFHLGHKMVADMMVYFQDLGASCYVCVADIESYLTRDTPLKEAKKTAIEEYLLNYIALGLKHKTTKFYFQSGGPKEYMNLSKTVGKRTTLNELRAIYGDLTPGKITSALTQVADILFPQLERNGGPKPVVVPVGMDQLPHINLSRDITSRMKKEKLVLPSATFSKLLPGLKGGKMSSSDHSSAIFLTDSPKEVKQKINKYAFSGGQATIEEHRKKGGNPDIDVSYQYLKMFFEPDDKKLQKIYGDYKSGALLTGELKAILIDKINTFLKKHQEKREKARKVLDKYMYK